MFYCSSRKKMVMEKDSDTNEDEMVYIVVKDEFDDGDKMALISHVRKNDT